jgi:hypothetical protein
MPSVLRRHLVTTVTLLVLLGVLCVMAAVGVKQALEPFPAKKKPTATGCSHPQKQVQEFLTRKDVQVSVFNAGSRNGLASETLAKVEAAGFAAGNAGNAPGTANVRRAVVWTTKADDYSAKLVALAFGPQTQVQVTKTDLGPGVDVLVGNAFKGLPKHAPARLRLPKPLETCIEGG